MIVGHNQDYIQVNGYKPKTGSVKIAGAKNSVLALLPATLLTAEPSQLFNVPNLSDVNCMIKLLEQLGASVIWDKMLGRVQVDWVRGIINNTIDSQEAGQMRASILLLGPVLAATGRVRLPFPGGCAIGDRPIDMHLNGMKQLGANVIESETHVDIVAPRGLVGANITLPFPSVGTTENLILAGVIAQGRTIINNAALEPEITDLVQCLNKMGAKIEGERTSRIVINGVRELRGAEFNVMPDRIELGSYMLLPGFTGKPIEIQGGDVSVLKVFVEQIEKIGLGITLEGNTITVFPPTSSIKPVDLKTAVYPGFPTDLQPQVFALMCFADGESTIEETIFENRMMHVSELQKMGANINVVGRKATINGVQNLHGTTVRSTDLRASMALLLAATKATGETKLYNVEYLFRGYANIITKLKQCGICIEHVKQYK